MTNENSAFTRWGTVLFVVAVVTALPVGVGAASTTASSQPRVVYATSGELHVLASDGSTSSLGVSAAIAGPGRNLDDDARVEYPYVDSSGALHAIDSEGESRTLVSGGVATSKTLLATGDFDGDGTPAVFYSNSDDNGYLYRVEPGESPQRVLATQVKAALGVVDFDGDGDTDVVFLGSSSTIKYYDGSNVGSTGYSSIGANNGLGAGPPADLDGDGTYRVPVVTGSQTIALVGANGDKTELNPNYQSVSKAPIGVADVTGDKTPEVVHINSDNSALYYITLDGSTGAVTDASGASISAGTTIGAVPVLEVAPPNVSNYSVSNPSGRTIEVQFDATQKLTDIRVDVSGPDATTLTRSDFNETGSGPYTYTATYTAEAEGDYTATLETAANAAGDAASGQSGSVTIEIPTPTVRDVSLIDQTDENGVVADGDRVTVTAKIDGENLTVTADLAAFGAGTVTLVHQTGSTYRANAVVDADEAGQDGPHSVRVNATNEYGKSDTATSGSISLDTTGPTASLDAPYIATVDEPVRFEATASTDNIAIASYEWRFGDGTSTSGMEVSHTFTATGTYTITLTVTDKAGHTDTASAAVIVEAESNSSTNSTQTTETPTPTINTGVSIQTTRLSSTRVTATVENATAGNRVLIRLPTAESASPVPLARMGVVPLEDGDFTVTANSFGAAPADVPRLERSRSVAPLSYFTLQHSISNANIGSGTLTVVVPASELGGRDPSHVTLYRYHGGEWNALATTLVSQTATGYRFRAQTPGMSAFAVGIQHPEFRVRNATLGETELADPGTVEITATVENSGEVTGEFEATLVVNGSVVTTRTVSVPADETRIVTFTRQFDPGTYEIAVNDTEAGVLVVGNATSPAANVQKQAGAASGLPCGTACDVVLASLLAVVLAVSLAVRRRRHTPDINHLRSLLRDR